MKREISSIWSIDWKDLQEEQFQKEETKAQRETRRIIFFFSTLTHTSNRFRSLFSLLSWRRHHSYMRCNWKWHLKTAKLMQFLNISQVLLGPMCKRPTYLVLILSFCWSKATSSMDFLVKTHLLTWLHTWKFATRSK